MKNPALNSIPLVSIALASYNGEKYISEQLDSLLNQSYPNIEIIISDDGSTDNTISILESYASRYHNIFVLINEGKTGVGNNFTNALNHCNAQLIALCDQDDIWLPEKIELLVNQIGHASLIYHDSLLINEDGHSLKRTAVQKKYSGNDPKTFLLNNVVSGHACLFKKDLLNDALPFPSVRYHDWWLAAMAADQHGVIFCPEILVHYRQHENNTTDFLGTRENFKQLNAYECYTEEVLWFKNFKRLKNHHSFFHHWYILNRNKPSKWICIRLFILCFIHRKSLFSHFNKSNTSIFFRCIQFVWGFKFKRLFDKKYDFADSY